MRVRRVRGSPAGPAGRSWVGATTQSPPRRLVGGGPPGLAFAATRKTVPGREPRCRDGKQKEAQNAAREEVIPLPQRDEIASRTANANPPSGSSRRRATLEATSKEAD
ncbi:MAG: hypothetical protein BroJett022_08510 [Actinomycetes bacterium]|nr:MAG: hypothetical protein BroJett022_08510 [Actinomycetes bacterium]